MKPCKCCRKPISPNGRNKHRPVVYCSTLCQNRYQNGLKIKAWLAGKFEGVRGSQFQLSSTIRNYILETRGHKCNKCGWAVPHPVSGKVPVQVHHIDGNALNTKQDNLEVLCPNCHALTPSWGAGNRGFGRTSKLTHNQNSRANKKRE